MRGALSKLLYLLPIGKHWYAALHSKFGNKGTKDILHAPVCQFWGGQLNSLSTLSEFHVRPTGLSDELLNVQLHDSGLVSIKWSPYYPGVTKRIRHTLRGNLIYWVNSRRRLDSASWVLIPTMSNQTITSLPTLYKPEELLAEWSGLSFTKVRMSVLTFSEGKVVHLRFGCIHRLQVSLCHHIGIKVGGGYEQDRIIRTAVYDMTHVRKSKSAQSSPVCATDLLAQWEIK